MIQQYIPANSTVFNLPGLKIETSKDSIPPDASFQLRRTTKPL
jgi:hypothetical protein